MSEAKIFTLEEETLAGMGITEVNDPKIYTQLLPLLSGIKRGDIVVLKPFSEDRQYGDYIYDGTKLIWISDEDGHTKIPQQFQAISEFPPNYWAKYAQCVPFKITFPLRIENVMVTEYSSGEELRYIPFAGPDGKVYVIVEDPREISESKEVFLKSVKKMREFTPSENIQGKADLIYTPPIHLEQMRPPFWGGVNEAKEYRKNQRILEATRAFRNFTHLFADDNM